MIKCRAYGHRWEDLGWLALVSPGIRLWSQQFRCDRCDMLRYDRYTHATMSLDQRKYAKPTGYPGGLRHQTYANLLETKPADAVRKSVRGMLPKNRLGRQMLKKLKVYTGPHHPHAAQQPTPLAIEDARRS